MISIGRNSKIQKIAVVIVFLVVIALVTYLFYDHWKHQEEWGESLYFTRNIETEDLRNYHLIETPEGRFVVNDNVGLRFSVPDGWSVEMVEEYNELRLLSQDLEMNEEETFPLDGCIIGAGVTTFIKDFPSQRLRPQTVQKKIDGEKDLANENQEIINIDGLSAVRSIGSTHSIDGRLIITELPINDTLYHFGMAYTLADEIKCRNYFDNFLNSITIDLI